MLKITIVYDNTVCKEGLKPDWGFAAIVDIDEHRILFDAGADGHILLNNMKVCGVDPKSVDTVFISHHHFDHTGGLAAFIHENPEVEVYVPTSLRGLRRAKAIHHISEAREIFKNVYSSGELKNIEQSMFIETPQGLVVIAGCSHPGVDAILEKARKYGQIYFLFGGFHGFRDFNLLKDIDFVCPTHCTQQIKKIVEIYPEKYIKGGAGREISLPIKQEREL
ncbi:MAG: MBL fold metallo-hydrolase [Candidatus Neomarinimicrobiota bacterium]